MIARNLGPSKSLDFLAPLNLSKKNEKVIFVTSIIIYKRFVSKDKNAVHIPGKVQELKQPNLCKKLHFSYSTSLLEITLVALDVNKHVDIVKHRRYKNLRKISLCSLKPSFSSLDPSHVLVCDKKLKPKASNKVLNKPTKVINGLALKINSQVNEVSHFLKSNTNGC